VYFVSVIPVLDCSDNGVLFVFGGEVDASLSCLAMVLGRPSTDEQARAG
jgi:hypothetical protein